MRGTEEIDMADRQGAPYDDILARPRWASARHAHIPQGGRAAQFAPFDALTGLDADAAETARLTDRQRALGEDAAAQLDRQLALLRDRAQEMPEVTVTYFIPDTKKDGGRYTTVSDKVSDIDARRRILTLADKTAVPIDAILSLDGAVLRWAEDGAD